MVGTPLGMLNCPSRRASVAYPLASSYVPTTTNYTCPANIAKSDYAACAGTSYNDFPVPTISGPVRWRKATGLPGGPTSPQPSRATGVLTSTAPTTGIFGHSELTTAQVTDGTSCTLCLAEVHKSRLLCHQPGQRRQSQHVPRLHQGRFRTAGYRYWPAIQDQEGNAYYAAAFGSAHASSWNTCFCDGSVRGSGIQSTTRSSIISVVAMTAP